MRQGIAVAFAALLLLASAGIRGAAQDKPTNNADGKAQLISTAQITKIDLKKQTLKVRNVAASMNDGSAGGTTNSGAGRTSGGGGYPSGGMGIPGGGRRGGGMGRGGSNGPTNPSQEQLGPEYTVYIGKTTAIKDEDRPMEFQDLKWGIASISPEHKKDPAKI